MSQEGAAILSEISKHPHIIAIVDHFLGVDDLRYLKDFRVRFLELRADAFQTEQIESKLFHFADKLRNRGFRLLGTFRTAVLPPSLSGNNATKQNSHTQKIVYKQLLQHIDMIDIEYESTHRAELFHLAKSQQCLTILSTHNFQKIPASSELEAVLAEGYSLKADILKFAYYAHNINDVKRMAEWMGQCDFPYITWMAMGNWGMISRIMAPYWGSRFCYGFIHKANAPGQLSVSDLHENLMRYHPAYEKAFSNYV